MSQKDEESAANAPKVPAKESFASELYVPSLRHLITSTLHSTPHLSIPLLICSVGFHSD